MYNIEIEKYQEYGRLLRGKWGNMSPLESM